MEERHYILLSKFLSEDLNAEEQREFSQWLNADIKNKNILEEFKKTWEISGQMQTDFTPNVDAAWNKIKERTKTSSSVIDIEKKQTYTFSLWKVAAIFILLAGSFFLIKKMAFDQTTNSNLPASFATKTEKSFVQLPDGSKVWLSSNTNLSYSENFNVEKREVYFTGEAFFEITRDEKKPFIIISGITKTTVLGTAFNLRSYPEETAAELTVEHGKVSFSLQNEDAVKEVILEKDDKGIINKETYEIIKENSDINFLAWKKEKLVFNKTELEKVARALARYYNTPIEIETPAIRKCLFTGSFEKPKLEEVLNVLKITMNIDYKKEQNKIILFGKGCN